MTLAVFENTPVNESSCFDAVWWLFYYLWSTNSCTSSFCLLFCLSAELLSVCRFPAVRKKLAVPSIVKQSSLNFPATEREGRGDM